MMEQKLDYIYRLLLEGRVEDVKKKYFGQGNLKSEKDYQILVQHDPSDNHKYLEWMAKELAKKASWVLSVTPNYLVGLVKRFHDNLHKIEEKDLYKYNGWRDLEEAVKIAESKLSKSEEKKLVKEETVKIYEDDKILVVSPKTQKSSCHYGSGTRWCTAAKKDNRFESYSEDGILVYFIMKLIKPPKKEHYDFEDSDALVKPEFESDSQRGDYYGDLDYYLTYAKLAMYIPFGESRKKYLYDMDYEMYDSQDELISDDGPWYDWVTVDDSVKNIISSNIIGYFNEKVQDHLKKGPSMDTKLYKTIVEHDGSVFNQYSNGYKFGNAFGRLDDPDNRGFDIVDNNDKYFISVKLSTNQYDTIYLDMSIVDYENPGDILDKASIEKRVPMDIYMSEYDFDPRLIHWTCLVIGSTATALIKRYEMKKRTDEKRKFY